MRKKSGGRGGNNRGEREGEVGEEKYSKVVYTQLYTMLICFIFTYCIFLNLDNYNIYSYYLREER
jgi:hypothetical protein